jgi:hypothetical protein
MTHPMGAAGPADPAGPGPGTVAAPGDPAGTVAAPGDGDQTSLPAQVPLLLLPVRLETRFVASPATPVGNAGPVPVLPILGPPPAELQLLLRVYPDTISTSSFEPELTTDEIAAGTAYWQARWAAGDPPAAEQGHRAWQAIADRFGAPRAAWIAAALTPANLAGHAPGDQPVFPQPAIRASSYERAPAARALPDYWTVVLERAGTRRTVAGSAIAADLAVGFTPHDGVLPDGLPVDAGMRWLVDFATAEQAGMGVRIPLSTDEQAGGFDRIVVFGLRDAAADGPGQDALAALLDAHHYTDGLALVPQGAPTNNTSDAAAAFSSADPDQSISFAVEAGADLAADPVADGPVLAAALGLPAGTFGHVRHADGHGSRSAADMLTALWPATFGYFLDQMMSPQFTAAQQDAMRSFALATVRPRGPLAALRVGATPYGVLPTTSLAAIADARQAGRGPGSGRARGILARLGTLLLPAWQASTAAVPHIGAAGDPDSDLAQILGMDGSSVAYRGRRVVGDDLLWNMMAFLDPGGPPSQEWWAEHLARGRALLDSLGLASWDPRVIHTAMGRDSYPVPYPSVQAAPLSETEPLAADATLDGAPVNYIQWLAHAPMADVWAQNYPAATPTSILYRVLRQSMLREYVTQAGRAQVATGVLAAAELREAELVNIQADAPTRTARDIVEQPIAPGSAVTWAAYLDTYQPPPDSPVAALAELRASLDRLALLPTAELDRLLSETLDSASHRLDVWITAVSTSLLADQRAADPAGQGAAGGQGAALHLGAYGWVDNVVPAPPQPVATGADAAAVSRLDQAQAQRRGLDSAALTPARLPHADSGGYLHAPSMTQAAAGAVLRSGYLSHRGTPDEPALAIDLSSARTSAALWLLAGVRQGLSLGALTGFQFEQALHEQSLDVYLQPFRDAYPLIGDELTGTTASGAVIPPSQVADGVKLRAAWQSGAFTPGASWGSGLPGPGDPAQAAVLAVLGQIDDMLSALSDVSVAESVFQIMRGNYGRAGGILDAVSRGEHPPDPDVVVTPRPGVDITHRLMLLLAGPPPRPASWDGITARPRAVAEPWLSDWVAGRLPDPFTVRALASWTVDGQAHAAVVSLRDLDIGPLDVLALSDAADQPQRAELESRLLLAASPPAAAASVTLSYSADHLPAGSVIFPDLLTAARAVRSLLGAARPLDLPAFALPDKAPASGSVDLAELADRVAALNGGLDTDLGVLQGAVTALAAVPASQPAAAAVMAALVTASGYALPAALPDPALSAAALLELGQRTIGELQQRRAAVTGQTATLAQVTADAHAVLGAGVLLLPRLTPPDAAAVQAAFGESAAMQAADPQAVRRWLLQLSHIRPGPQRLDLAIATTRLLGAGRPAIEIAQLPQADGDRWLGLPFEPGSPPAGGRVAIEAVTTGDPVTAGAYAGLLIDEWLERIPADRTTAGVAFHYDEPKARAPQAMLLALCPDGRATWDRPLVADILDETCELARIRGVDLASIQEVGQIVPALYFPFNLAAATPATTFWKEVLTSGNLIPQSG